VVKKSVQRIGRDAVFAFVLMQDGMFLCIGESVDGDSKIFTFFKSYNSRQNKASC